jgi:hypothetical protein
MYRGNDMFSKTGFVFLLPTGTEIEEDLNVNLKHYLNCLVHFDIEFVYM